jgi:WS/DGAT/MGAT family acyltransferase
MVYEGDFTRAEVIALLEARLHLIPRYRQRLVEAPFGIAHPAWEDDPTFEVGQHVTEVTLPPPGDDAALAETGGDLYATMLRRDRPLWQAYVIRGRADGNTAVLWKVHHAMVDGIAGVDLVRVVHDLSRAAAAPDAPAVPWQAHPLPDPITRLQEAIRDRMTNDAERWTRTAFAWLRPAAAFQQAQAFTALLTNGLPGLLQPRRPVMFDGAISSKRRFVWAELPFDEVKSIRRALGGTVNDVVLTIVSGGLGHYLRGHRQRTDGLVLRAMCPVSMRGEDEQGTLGNLVSEIISPLYVGELDPVARFRAERTAMERRKAQDQAGGVYALIQSVDGLPPPLVQFAGRLGITTNLLMSTVNTVSTNVPGPPIPLYLAGRQLLGWYPLGPLSANIGLFNAILTYNGTLTIGATVDPLLMPDPWFYADCLMQAFTELRDAVRDIAPADAGATTAGA